VLSEVGRVPRLRARSLARSAKKVTKPLRSDSKHRDMVLRPGFSITSKKKISTGLQGKGGVYRDDSVGFGVWWREVFSFSFEVVFFFEERGRKEKRKKKGNQTDERPFCLRPLCFFFLPFLAPFFRHQALNLLPFFPPGTRGDSVTSRLVWGRGRFRGLWWRRVPARW